MAQTSTQPHYYANMPFVFRIFQRYYFYGHLFSINQKDSWLLFVVLLIVLNLSLPNGYESPMLFDPIHLN